MKRYCTIPLFILFVLTDVIGQSPMSWEEFSLNRQSSLRGIDAVSDKECWVSGTNGTVAKTVNGGRNWKYLTVPGADSLDFRDIEVFNSNEALILSIGTGASSRIYKTIDGGQTWKIVFQNKEPEGFFDAFTFWNANEGMMQGDPIDGRLYLLTTADRGDTWHEVPQQKCPKVEKGEYAFAASGSQIASFGNTIWIGTGGSKSRIFRSNTKELSWEGVDTKMIQGQPSQGAFSLSFFHERFGMAVGGDYTKENEGKDNIIITVDGGESWHLLRMELDFRSCLVFVGKSAIVTGPSGSELSDDMGKSWTMIQGRGFHSLSVVEGSKTVWAAGSDGRIGRLVLP